MQFFCSLTGSQAEPGNPRLEALPPIQKATQKLHELLPLKTHKVNRLGSASRNAFPARAWEQDYT
jgi:hypothetical protein